MNTRNLILVLLVIFLFGIILLLWQVKEQEEFKHLVQILSNGDLYWWPQWKDQLEQQYIKGNLGSPLTPPFIEGESKREPTVLSIPPINIPTSPNIGYVQPIHINCQKNPQLCQDLKKPYGHINRSLTQVQNHSQRYAYNPSEYPFNQTYAS